MAVSNYNFIAIGCLIFGLILCSEAQLRLNPLKIVPKLTDSLSNITAKIVLDAAKVFQSPVTRDLCELKTVNKLFEVIWIQIDLFRILG